MGSGEYPRPGEEEIYLILKKGSIVRIGSKEQGVKEVKRWLKFL